MPDPSITDQLRAMIPQNVLTDELTAAIEGVAKLEHEHHAATEQTRLERAFLERAPREGLLYPGDALKLDDVLSGLRDASDAEPGLNEVFQRLRSRRPYLFGVSPASPANQKLSESDPESLRESLRHGSLTRQVQDIRRRRR